MLGLPGFGKSSAIRLLFDRRGNRVRIRPDPFGGRVRRRVVGESLPVARLENRSRLARPVSESVAGRGEKSENSKLAERGGFEPPNPGIPQIGGLANRCFQPLSHLSKLFTAQDGHARNSFRTRVRHDWLEVVAARAIRA